MGDILWNPCLQSIGLVLNNTLFSLSKATGKFIRRHAWKGAARQGDLDRTLVHAGDADTSISVHLIVVMPKHTGASPLTRA